MSKSIPDQLRDICDGNSDLWDHEKRTIRTAAHQMDETDKIFSDLKPVLDAMLSVTDVYLGSKLGNTINDFFEKHPEMKPCQP